MSSKSLSQSQEMHKKVLKLSRQNKKLLESLSSHLILQSSYLDRYIKREPNGNSFSLQQKYQNLLTESNGQMLRNQILQNQLQQKRKYVESLKQQIDKYEMQSIKIDHEMTKSERKLMQQEELQKQYQFELMKKNAQLKKQLEKVQDNQKSLIEQNSLYQRQSIQLHATLDNANHELKQAEFIFNKKQQEEKDLINQLEGLKRQMVKKKEKLMKSYIPQNQPKQKNTKNQIIKEIDAIQSLISDYKRSNQSKINMA